MLNAPEERARGDHARSSRARASPSVLPLAEPGMVAVHALVPAADVWRLLPQLEAAGGSSILLVPVERMLGVSGVAEIVEDVRVRGDAAVREWALRARRRRAGACGAAPARLPEEALLALADARPALARGCSARPTSAGGHARCRARAPLGAARLGRRLRPARPRLDAGHVRRPRAGGRRRAHRRRDAARRRRARRRRGASCSESTRCGRSAVRTRSRRSPTARRRSRASTRSSAPAAPT